MKRLRLQCSFILLLAGSILVFCSSASGEIENRIVAVVNNEVVTLYELNTSIRELTGIPSTELKARSEKMYLETRRKVLDDLIDQKENETGESAFHRTPPIFQWCCLSEPQPV